MGANDTDGTGQGHAQRHTVTCSRCGLVAAYWGPLGNRRCRRCGLVLWVQMRPPRSHAQQRRLVVAWVVAVLILIGVAAAWSFHVASG